MAEDFRPEEDDRVARSAYPGRGRRSRRLMTALVAVAAVFGFGVILVYAYNKGRQDGETRVPPVIQAQEGPTKIRPDTPGGMQVPDRDKEVFSRLEAETQAQKVERLLPPPEKPMAPPPPAAAPEKLPAAEPAAGGTGTGAVHSVPMIPPAPGLPPSAKAIEPPTMPAPPEKAATPAPSKTPAKTAAKTASATPAKAAAKPAAKGGWRVQISSLRSDDAARKAWASLSKKNADLLGKLSLTVERKDLGGGKGTYYRMQAGPLASRDAADALCGRLKQRKIGCLVVAP